MSPLSISGCACGLIAGTWLYQAMKAAPRWETSADASFGILLLALVLIWENRNKDGAL